MVNNLARPLLIFALSYARACDIARELALNKPDFIYADAPSRLRGLENMAYLIDDSFYQQELSAAAKSELLMCLARLRPLTFEEYFSMRQAAERLRSTGPAFIGLDPAFQGTKATVALQRPDGSLDVSLLGVQVGATVKVKLPESYKVAAGKRTKKKKPQK